MNQPQALIPAVAWNFAAKTPENAAFVRDYQATFHREPDYHSAANYSAMHVFAAAIKQAGSINQEKIRDALATIRVPTLVGTYRVNPANGIQLGYTSYIIQWQNGKQEIVYPGNVATAKPLVPFPAWSSPNR